MTMSRHRYHATVMAGTISSVSKDCARVGGRTARPHDQGATSFAEERPSLLAASCGGLSA